MSHPAAGGDQPNMCVPHAFGRGCAPWPKSPRKRLDACVILHTVVSQSPRTFWAKRFGKGIQSCVSPPTCSFACFFPFRRNFARNVRTQDSVERAVSECFAMTRASERHLPERVQHTHTHMFGWPPNGNDSSLIVSRKTR